MNASPSRSPSQLLRLKLSLVGGSMEESFASFWSRAEEPQTYASYLLFIHQVIRASVPLMEVAHRVALEQAERDPACAALAGYLKHHTEEERNHDLWALDDLEELGLPRSAVLAKIPSARIASLVGAQYYWTLHHHPVALLGYIAVLEASPPCLDFVERLRQRTGAPAGAFRTLRIHGEADPHHSADLDRFLDEAPLLPEHLAVVGVSLIHTVAAVTACVEELT